MSRGAGLRRPALPLSDPATLIATWFGTGLLRPFPGTWGSIAALPFAALLAWLGGPTLLLAATVVVCGLGVWAGDRYEAAGKVKDPSAVVIDEVAGQWLVLLAAPVTWQGYLFGFVVFRIVDILKPWPASWADREVQGGLGIMLDDLLAAAYGALVMFATAWFWPELLVAQ
jgi:phosphatidylglycerophosphatase A